MSEMKRQSEGEQPVIVISVKSLDKSLRLAEENGAIIVMPKMTVMEMGHYARISDTEGNIIGVWETIKKRQ
ncbi:MAG: hypothetical protein ABIF10_07190 [Candidatus Woesearchaeota archaeon]